MSFIDPENKLLGHLDRLADLQAGRTPSAPINVEVDLTNRCSLGCSWCHFAYTHTRGPLAGKRPKPEGAVPGGDVMELGMAISLVDELVSAGVHSVTWTGGGEPTLHPHFNSIICHGDGRIAQGLYTHGGHMTVERADLLKRIFTFVYVSLDAADAESYKRDKGVDRFGAACRGIRLLSTADGDGTVGVGYLVNETNWGGITAAAELAWELEADYIQFRPTIQYDQQLPDVVAEDTTWLEDAISEIEAINGDPFVVADLDRFRMYQNWTGHTYETCFWSGLQTVVTPNGKMWTCVNKREHAGAEIGDLTVETFQEAWRRHTVAKVGADCRVMCRGHLSNLALNKMLIHREHAEFV